MLAALMVAGDNIFQINPNAGQQNPQLPGLAIVAVLCVKGNFCMQPMETGSIIVFMTGTWRRCDGKKPWEEEPRLGTPTVQDHGH